MGPSLVLVPGGLPNIGQGVSVWCFEWSWFGVLSFPLGIGHKNTF